MTELEALQAELETLRADGTMDRDERTRQMRRIRKKIRDLRTGDEIAPEPVQKRSGKGSPDARTTAKKRRSGKTGTRILPATFWSDILVWFSNHPDLFEAEMDPGDVGYGYISALILETAQKTELSAEQMAQSLVDRFTYRWKREPEWYSLRKQGDATIIVFGPVPDDPNW